MSRGGEEDAFYPRSRGSGRFRAADVESWALVLCSKGTSANRPNLAGRDESTSHHSHHSHLHLLRPDT